VTATAVPPIAARGFAAVRLSLARSRERGVPFSRAWKTAMRTTHPNSKTYAALKATKHEWRSAYKRDPATPREAAAGRLAALWLDRTA
jgi:hypothetical protein